MSQKLIKEITDYQTIYTISVIREGRFDGVIWPYLGKIRAAIKTVQGKVSKVGFIKSILPK